MSGYVDRPSRGMSGREKGRLQTEICTLQVAPVNIVLMKLTRRFGQGHSDACMNRMTGEDVRENVHDYVREMIND